MKLLELVIALGLAGTVTAAGMNLLSLTVREQIREVRQTRLQGDAYLGWRAVENDVRQATAILTPAAVGKQGDALTGCDNYDPALGTLNPSQPAAGFAYCVIGATLYRYPLSTCPPGVLPACASAGGLPVAANVSHAAGAGAYFSRPAPGVVRFAGQTSSSGQSQSVDVTIAFNAAAGSNQ